MLDPDPDSMNLDLKHWPRLLSLYWLVNQVHFSLMTANVKAKALRATFSPFRFLRKVQASPPPFPLTLTLPTKQYTQAQF
jgi:hypothetical protein